MAVVENCREESFELRLLPQMLDVELGALRAVHLRRKRRPRLVGHAKRTIV
jgi:hypothetical protein